MANDLTVETSSPGSEQDERLTEALARFKLSAEAEDPQRKRELEDIRFIDFDEQWPEVVKAQRAGLGAARGMPAVPERACLTINKLRQPVQQITNQARQARLALHFAPKGSGASQDVAEAYEDICRAIQTDSRAHLARQWAFDRAVKCGRGFYRILTEYANDGDFDLDVIYKRILNQATVYLDPSAQEPDWSDGEWAFVTEDIPWKRYKREYKDSKLGMMSDSELEATGDEQPDWIKDGTDKDSHTGKVIRIAEYWYVEHTTQEVQLYALSDGSERSFPPDKAPPDAQPVIGPNAKPLTRELDVRTVKWCKVNAIEVLEAQDWPGRYIPIVPVIAQESNANGERRWQGIVRPSRDAQMSYNVMRSAQVEAIGLAPKAPFMLDPEQIESFEPWWNQLNVRNFPWLPRKAFHRTGVPYPDIQRQVAEPAIQAITLATHEADGDIKATTGIFDPSLGNLSPQERSGRAILALQKQGEMSTAGDLDNLASMSMVYEGKIIRDLIKVLYNRKGRIVAAMGADDQRRNLLIGQPFMLKNGQPQPVPPGTPGAKMLDLAQGEYQVAVKVGKSNTTRREEGVQAMSEVISAVPQIFPIVGDLYVGEMDFPGARQMADRLKKTLPPNLQDQQDGQNVAQLQQQLQQLQRMAQMLTQELNAKNQVIETEQVKAQRDLSKSHIETQGETERFMAEQATKERLEMAKLQLEYRKIEADLEIEAAKLGSVASLKRAEIEQEQLHQHGDAVLQQQEMGVDAAQADMDRQSGRDEAERDRQFQSAESEAERHVERETTETVNPS